MAEDFEGEPKPVAVELKPEQQTLRDRQDVWSGADSGLELDKLFEAQNTEGDKKAEGEGEGAKKAEGEGEGDKKAEGEGEGDKKAAEGTPTGDATLDNLPDPDTIVVPRDAGDAPKAADIKPKEEAAVDDPYPDVKLPDNVKGKSAEAWAEVKSRFAGDLKARDSEIADLKAQVAGADKVTPLTAETKVELESLREFKAKLDIEADPNFQAQFDGKITRATEFVMSQLAASGFDKAAVDRVREVGVENVDWEALSDKMNPQVRRLVQSRLDEIEVAKFDKEEKLKAVKKDVGAYIAEQRKGYAERGTKHLEDTETQLAEFTAKMPFLGDPSPLKATATSDERAVFEATEVHRKNILASLTEAKNDDSPYMRALLIAGMGQLLNLKPRFEQLGEYSKQQDAKLEKALSWIEKVKASGKPKDKAAEAAATPPKAEVNYGMSAGMALDALRKVQSPV